MVKWTIRYSHLVRNNRTDHHFPEPLDIQGIADACIGLLAKPAKDVTHRATRRPLTRRLDFDMHRVRAENAGRDDGSHSTRVMHRGSRKAIVFTICVPKEGEEVCYKGCYGTSGSTQATYYLFS